MKSYKEISIFAIIGDSPCEKKLHCKFQTTADEIVVTLIAVSGYLIQAVSAEELVFSLRLESALQQASDQYPHFDKIVVAISVSDILDPEQMLPAIPIMLSRQQVFSILSACAVPADNGGERPSLPN